MENKGHWKKKFNDILNVCQDEVKRTTKLGKKMLSASKENTCLNDAYRDLGKHICNEVNSNKLDLDDNIVNELILKISECKVNLEKIETDLKDIKERPTTKKEDSDESSQSDQKDNLKD